LIQSALLGGVFIGVLSALPVINIANCCCLWITGGGVLAGYLLRQNDPRGLTAGRGALAGLLAGVIGAFVWLVTAAALDVFIAPLQDRILAEMMNNAQDMPPEVRDWLEQMTASGSMPLRMAMGFFFQFFAGVVFSTLGGLLASTFFKRQTLPGDVIPPPIPPQS
jgi:uncharacterized membrane protein YeaQ/YmgE (transglycosylase-associated protein family)